MESYSGDCLLYIYVNINDISTIDRNSKFYRRNYKIFQTCTTAVFVIGALYIHHGLAPYYDKYVIPIIMGNNFTSSRYTNQVLFWTMTTITNRIIVVPIALVILNILTWQTAETMIIRTMSVLFLICDPVVSFITICATRKYGNETQTKPAIEQELTTDNERIVEESQHLNA